EFEIQLGLGSAVVPVGKKFKLAPSQLPLRERGASDGDANARRLPGDPTFLCDRFRRGNDTARDETLAAFVLAREDKDRIAFGNAFATIHRLLRGERERLRSWLANLGFDREHARFHSALSMSWPCLGERGLTDKADEVRAATPASSRTGVSLSGRIDEVQRPPSTVIIPSREQRSLSV